MTLIAALIGAPVSGLEILSSIFGLCRKERPPISLESAYHSSSPHYAQELHCSLLNDRVLTFYKLGTLFHGGRSGKSTPHFPVNYSSTLSK